MADRLPADHGMVLARGREAIAATGDSEDWGTNDLPIGDVLRRRELEVGFGSSHLVDIPIGAPS